MPDGKEHLMPAGKKPPVPPTEPRTLPVRQGGCGNVEDGAARPIEPRTSPVQRRGHGDVEGDAPPAPPEPWESVRQRSHGDVEGQAPPLPLEPEPIPTRRSSRGTVDRRHALKIMAFAAASPAIASCAPDSKDEDGNADATDDAIARTPNPAANPKARGDAWDPDLINPTIPWERQLRADELESLAVLCDLIIPADERSPAASELGAHDFIDEWVSAPYEANRNDLVLIRGGLRWFDREADRRFGGGDSSGGDSFGIDPSGGGPSGAPPDASGVGRLRFRDLPEAEQTAICDEICHIETAPSQLRSAARFFDRVRYLTSTAFWTTDEGMDDLQYMGNVPLPSWHPPPDEVLRHIGLA